MPCVVNGTVVAVLLLIEVVSACDTRNAGGLFSSVRACTGPLGPFIRLEVTGPVHDACGVGTDETVLPPTVTPAHTHSWRGVNPAVSVDQAAGVSVLREASA